MANKFRDFMKVKNLKTEILKELEVKTNKNTLFNEQIGVGKLELNV